MAKALLLPRLAVCQQQQVIPRGHVAEVYDVVVVGAGIVGLATAREISKRYPNKTICVIEKEGEVAGHQTNHNSGVIHAGMYYEPGSVMAKCCVRGADLMYEYCGQNNLPHRRCGKMIVASTPDQDHWVKTLYERGNQNGVKGLEILNSQQIQEREPAVRGSSALWSPNTGIVDFAAVARHMAKELLATGRHDIRLRFQVTDFKVDAATNVVEVIGVEPGQKGPTKRVRGRNVITCAGLHADTVASRGGGRANPKVVPFRGSYWQLKSEYKDMVTCNVYPVPSGGGIPVGVHFTPTVNEQRGEGIIVGPGACIAFDREGYNFFDLSLRDLFDITTNIGFWRFAISNLSLSLGEMYRDLNKRAFMNEARKLIPTITDDMVEESFAGVMVQVFESDGKASKDFIFERNCLSGTTLHVRSAPSPACTSSMAIAEYVADTAAQDFGW
ncbi:uncharacterized protein MONBRDRAFT_27529 [Monosiga brevicollis MX1]|uniref:L-2-hydroxyglutarate dehydrogenase, mitochondrial n=1 Tax=Monosiga brevicollis TaxID=81824 RepID=A9V5J4_MONBE|nr:uncharacterized protein MONBRDRAFT_27529 [Monosiga brevicollis MX1]EDQ87294.1 predicted protein [Monosiga brevicollis MX1]|eukprot:XP_001747907.1 hypothetical protein [Monosiga brevicollis MX1]